MISPLLANTYLHYAFDLWLNRESNRSANGDVTIVRHADDAVIGFQFKNDAKACLDGLKKRLLSKIKWIKVELRKRPNFPPQEIGKWLRKMIQGHLNYYEVSTNGHSLTLFVEEITHIIQNNVLMFDLR